MMKRTAADNHKYHLLADTFCQDNRETQFLLNRMRAHDTYIYEHSLRAAYISLLLAQGLGLPAEEQKLIYRSALLMDIGKLQTEDIKSAGNETGASRRGGSKRSDMQHPIFSARLLESMAEAGQIDGEAILHHHENLDGTGYPYGLVWEDIGLNARILRVADSFTTMTSLHPRTGALEGIDAALNELYCWSDIHYDSDLVAVVCQAYSVLEKKNRPREDKGFPQIVST